MPLSRRAHARRREAHRDAFRAREQRFCRPQTVPRTDDSRPQVGIGLTLFVCELFSVYYTGGALNTARAFGPAAVTGFPHGTHWVVRPLWLHVLAPTSIC
jgi:glycerol uptake facilitator-like aquaporin